MTQIMKRKCHHKMKAALSSEEALEQQLFTEVEVARGGYLPSHFVAQ